MHPIQMIRQFYRTAPWQSKAHRVWFTLCAVCLALYTAYVTYLGKSSLFTGAAQTVAALVVYLLWAGVLFGLFLAAVPRGNNLRPQKTQNGKSLRLFWLGMGLSLVVLGFGLMACYPGGVSYDAANQWKQAQSGEYNNWHPVFHTLLIWLVTRVWRHYAFAVLVQLAAFSAAAAYVTVVLYKNGVPAWLALGVQLLVTLSDPVYNCLMYLWKDNAMTIGCLLLCGQCIQLLFSRGHWLKKPGNALAFGLVLAFTTLVRHNAILLTAPMLLLVFFCYGRKNPVKWVSVVSFGLCMVLVQGVLFGSLDVVYPDNTAEEAIGIPMMVLGNAKQQQPDALDVESSAFLADLATDEEWNTVYRRSDYNSIKFTYPRELIKAVPVTDILGMAARTAVRAPRLAFTTFNEATDLVWDISGLEEGYENVSNSGDLEEALYGSETLHTIGMAVSSVIRAPLELLPLRWLTRNIGVQLLLLLLVTLWALYRNGVGVLTMALPMLFYHLATMLLLCGQDARFFQFGMAVSLPSILALLYAPNTKEV